MRLPWHDLRDLTSAFEIEEFNLGTYYYYVDGFEQSRRFRSLKVWMSFKCYGHARLRVD
jgi:hypothetical protein